MEPVNNAPTDGKHLDIPEAPDPPNTPAGLWERRIRWAVGIIVALAIATVAVVNAIDPPTSVAPDAIVPDSAQQVIDPVSPVVPAGASLDTNPGGVAVDTLAAIVSAVVPVGCTAAQTATQAALWTAGGVGIAECIAKCALGGLTDNLTVTAANVTVDTSGLKDAELGCLTSCALSVGVPTLVSSIAEIASGGTRAMPRRMLVIAKPQ